MNVHLLVTIRKEELFPASVLVFKSIRTGFPTATITAHLNDWATRKERWGSVLDICTHYGVNPETIPPVEGNIEHHDWIRRLFREETDPFFVLDTDVGFWENFEHFDFSNAAMAGRYVPQFFCRFANAITRPRLHTCLLYIDPVQVRNQVDAYASQFPDTYCTPRPSLRDLVFPRYIPYKFGAVTKNYFHDTCCLLYQAIGGQPFDDQQNLAFDHAQSMTISDLVAPHYPGGDIREHHFAIFQNPEVLKGQWLRDKEFYRQRACD
jgi:hypothetical protein